MATNLLPIIAIGAAAFFLMKKGETSTPSKGTNGNGTNGNGTNGNGTDVPLGLQPGAHQVQVGEPLRLSYLGDMTSVSYSAPEGGDAINDIVRSNGPGYIDVQLLKPGQYQVTVHTAGDGDSAFILNAS